MNKLSASLLVLCLSLGTSLTAHGSSISEENSKESCKRKLENPVENSAKRLRGTLRRIQREKKRGEECEKLHQEWLKQPPAATKISFASGASSFEFLPWNEIYHKLGQITTSYETRVWVGENNTTIISAYKCIPGGPAGWRADGVYHLEGWPDAVYYHLKWTPDEIKVLDVVDINKEYSKIPYISKDSTFISSIEKLLDDTGVNPTSFSSPLGSVKIVEVTDISADGHQIAGLASHWGYDVPFRATLPSPVFYPEQDEAN
ncbi:MAG: hypothetical protein ACTHJ4_06935 [Candidatus Nucleicultricaceae bacterium]